MDHRDPDPRQDPDVRHSPPRPARLPARAAGPVPGQRVLRADDRRTGDQQHVPARPQRWEQRPDRLPKAAANTIPTTAEPRARLVARPNRVVPRSVRRTLAERRCERIVPRSWSAEKSCGRVSISSRGRGPRPAVRPTGACDREPGARPGCGVRPPSSCGRESRAPGAVTLLGLVGLLHRACLGSSPSGPGVPSVVDPLKARKRADRPVHGRARSHVRRIRSRPSRTVKRSVPATGHRNRGPGGPVLTGHRGDETHTPGSIADLPCEPSAAVLPFAPRRPGERPTRHPERSVACPISALAATISVAPEHESPHRSMDAKQVWRAPRRAPGNPLARELRDMAA